MALQTQQFWICRECMFFMQALYCNSWSPVAFHLCWNHCTGFRFSSGSIIKWKLAYKTHSYDTLYFSTRIPPSTHFQPLAVAASILVRHCHYTRPLQALEQVPHTRTGYGGRAFSTATPYRWLGSVVVGRRTRDREVASSTPGRCTGGWPRSTQPSIPPG